VNIFRSFFYEFETQLRRFKLLKCLPLKAGSHSRVTPTFVLVCSLVTVCYSTLYFWMALSPSNIKSKLRCLLQ